MRRVNGSSSRVVKLNLKALRRCYRSSAQQNAEQNK
jgi:hypothetical protein